MLMRCVLLLLSTGEWCIVGGMCSTAASCGGNSGLEGAVYCSHCCKHHQKYKDICVAVADALVGQEDQKVQE